MCSLSYGCLRMPVVARMCDCTARKNYLIHKIILHKSTGTRTKNILKNEQSRDAAAKKNRYKRSRDSNMRKSIYLLTTTPTSHTHIFHTHPPPANHTDSFYPLLLATPIHFTHSPQLSSILLSCAKLKVWMTIVESGWNVWVWLVGVVVRRYIVFLILLIPTSLVSVLFCNSISTFC